MVRKMTGLNPGFQHKNQFWKICTESWDISKNVSKFSFLSKMLKPICFEYHEPYNGEKNFWTNKGVLEF